MSRFLEGPRLSSPTSCRPADRPRGPRQSYTTEAGTFGLPADLLPADRDYIIHWLFKFADNVDPGTMIPGGDFRDDANERVDESEVSQFTAALKGFKMFNRLQVTYRLKDGKFNGAPKVLKRSTFIGTTANPCGSVLTFLAEFEGQKALLDGRLAPEADSISLVNDGSPDKDAIAAFNTLTGKDMPPDRTPVFWEDIGSRVQFSVASGVAAEVTLQPYPTYYEYRNGHHVDTTAQAQTPLDNFNEAPHPFGTVVCDHSNFGGITPGGRCGDARLKADVSARIPPSRYTCPVRCP
jgi:hypothetical protein